MLRWQMPMGYEARKSSCCCCCCCLRAIRSKSTWLLFYSCPPKFAPRQAQGCNSRGGMDPLTASLFSQNVEEHLPEIEPDCACTSNLTQLEAPTEVSETALCSKLLTAKITTAKAGSAGNQSQQSDALHPLSPQASTSCSSLHSSTGTEHASPLDGSEPQPDAQKPSSSADDLHKGRWRTAQDAERAVHSLNGRQAPRPSRQLICAHRSAEAGHS